MTDSTDKNLNCDALEEQDIGKLVSSTLYKLEYISDHHVKTRSRNRRITNIFVMVISALIFLIAITNLYYLNSFYNETITIVDTMKTMDDSVETVSESMLAVTGSMKKMNKHMAHMDNIYLNIHSISKALPLMQANMALVANNMGIVNLNMKGMNENMNGIGFHLNNTSVNVSRIRYGVHQIAEPMGKFNSVMP